VDGLPAQARVAHDLADFVAFGRRWHICSAGRVLLNSKL
jgi:hypothetical protein